MMQNELERKIWEAFAVGDAVGMPTEFMTRDDIIYSIGQRVEGLLPREKSFHHSDLPVGSVTDDTEQNLFLTFQYRKDQQITVENTVAALLNWIQDTDAVAKRYIGPSSKGALDKIRDGEDPSLAGRNGTTCGGIMRTPAAVLWNLSVSLADLEQNIFQCVLPTHNTSEALEAAGAYGFALRRAVEGGTFDEIFQAGLEGAGRLKKRAVYQACAPSSAARMEASWREDYYTEQELYHRLFYIWGTGLPSADVCGAVFAIFAYAKKDVWLAIRIAASLGGDTDTIAALVGALCTAYAGGHNIPSDVLNCVKSVNAELFASKLGV